jgi:hypothetical protein
MFIHGLDHFAISGEKIPWRKGFDIHMRLQSMWVREIKADLFGSVGRAEDQV